VIASLAVAFALLRLAAEPAAIETRSRLAALEPAPLDKAA
jgi:hypothetical protein